MKPIEYEDLSEKSTRERKELARTRWQSLPEVLKAIFDNAPKLSMYEVLRRLGVDAQPTRAVEWAYLARDGSVVVTVWHDQICPDQDGVLCYFIPTSKWRREGPLQQQRADQMRQVLADNVGKRVKAMLLKHEWDKNDTQYAEVFAADIKTWALEQLSDTEFLLRRITVR